MSYTHTLSIQGVQATLTMRVEHSLVTYTLIMRAESGEEVVSHGRLPHEDQFVVINQHFKNPAAVMDNSLSQEVKESLEKGVQTVLDDVVKEIPQHQLQNSYTSITMFGDLPDLEDDLSDTLSPILPSSPKHLDDSQFAQELHDLSGVAACGFYEVVQELPEEELPKEEPLKVEPPKEEPPKEEPKAVSAHFEAAMLNQLNNLQVFHRYSEVKEKRVRLGMIHETIVNNQVYLAPYPALKERIVSVCKELIVYHSNDSELVIMSRELLLAAGHGLHAIHQHLLNAMAQYKLLQDVSKRYQIDLLEDSMVQYINWKRLYTGKKLNRYQAMKTWLQNPIH